MAGRAHKNIMKLKYCIVLIPGLLWGVFSAQVTWGAEVASVRIGVTTGPQAEVLGLVQKLAGHYGIQLELVPFAAPDQINAALNRGSIDAASFEDGVALATSLAAHNYALISAAQTVTLPLGLYSRRLKYLGEIARGATIIVPTDPHDQGRALLLLYNYGLIDLRDGAGTRAKLRDITGNPREFHFKALAGEKLFAALAQNDLVAIDYETAARHDLAPARDSLGMDDARSPYAGVLTVRSADQKAAWLAELLRVYRSDEVKHFILTQYQDSVRRPW
jgi:D-methionine transport system substrate-binding protein